MRLAALLLLALVCAGCVSHEPAPAKPAAPTPAREAAPLLLAPAEAPAPPPPPISAALSLSGLWLKPLQEETATVTAPAGTTVTWFASIRGITSHLQVWNGQTFIVADHAKRVATYPATGDLPPGASASLRAGEAGLLSFVSRQHPGASFVATVRPGAPAEARVFLVGAPGQERFVPDRVEVAPQGALRVANDAQTLGDATGVSFLVLLPDQGPTLGLTGVDEGLYDVLALVRDGSGGQAELRGRFLVDFDRPDDTGRVGPAAGTFAQPPVPAAGAPAMTYALNASYPIQSMIVSYQAASRLPAPGSVRVTVLREGEPVSSASSATSSEMRLADLPAGRYAVRVEAEQGALVDWDLSAVATYRLPVPDAVGS